MVCLLSQFFYYITPVETNQLYLDELVIQVIRKPIKHLYIRIKPPSGLISVSIPLKAKLDWVMQHLEYKKEWIRASCARLEARRLETPVESETEVLFLGKSYPLVFQAGNARASIKLQDNCLVCNVSSPTERQRLLINWYREQFSALIMPLITQWEPIIGVKVHTLALRIMKTRWGSCNIRSKRICLNLNLIKKPTECMEYVLVHEMVHLLEASHNKRFYQLMDRFLPKWKERHKLLGQILF